MKRLITLMLFAIVYCLQLLADTDIVHMNVGDIRTLSLNGPTHIVGTQWTISDRDAVSFTSTPGAMATSATIEALSPRSAAERCIVHCTYYYNELDPVSGRYEYQRTGYHDWEIIIEDSGSSGDDDETLVGMHMASLSVELGKSVTVMAYTNNDYYSGSYQWTSSNYGIIGLTNQNGQYVTVNGLSEGTAYLRVTINNGNYYEIPVYVKIPSGSDDNDDDYFVYELTSDGNSYAVGWNQKDYSLRDIVIPSSYKGKPVTKIKDNGFNGCPANTIIIPNSVHTIGEGAFMKSHLLSLTIPSSVTDISSTAFTGMFSFKEFLVEPGNEKFASRDGVLFDNNFSKLIRFPEGKIRYVTGDEASYIIPNTVTEISSYAFFNCDMVASIAIPNSVSKIGDNAFNYCTGITSVDIPDSVTEMGEYIFANCTGLTIIKLPNFINEISNWAFENCTGLTSISIPNSVNKIGLSAFSACRSLSSVNIPNSVSEISQGSFWGCSNLTSVKIPNSISTINGMVFEDCTNLVSVTIPNSVRNMLPEAFSGCNSLAEINYLADDPTEMPSYSSGAFSKITYSKATLYVQQKAFEKVKTIVPWKNFANIQVKEFSEISDIFSDTESNAVEVFSLNGEYIGNNTESLSPGIYIIRQGSKITKLIVK